MSISTRNRVGVAGAVAATLLSASSLAAAAEPGFYVATDVAMDSADFGSSDFDGLFDSDELDFDVDDAGLDKSNAGFALAFGYQFNPYLAVEASYVNVGKVSYDASGTVDGGEGFTGDFAVGIDYKSKGPALAVVGSWPINEMFSIDGRVGAYMGKTTGFLSVSVDDETLEGPVASDTKTGLLVGVGATWTLTESVALRAGYTRLQDGVAERDVDRFSVGLRISF